MAKIEFIEHFHYDRGIEEAILGVCMLETNNFGLIQGMLQKECFYYEAHQLIYEGIAEMWKENLPIDILTVVNYVIRKNITLPGVEYPGLFVTKLTNAVVSNAHTEYHALKLREMYCERELVRLRQSPSLSDKDPLAKIDALKEQLDKLSHIKITNDWKDMGTNVVELAAHMAKVKDLEIIGAPMGYRSIDLMTSGLQPGTLTIIGARPSVGKTAFMNGLILHQACLEWPVGVISLETPRLRLTARMASHITRTDFHKIYRNNFYEEKQRRDVYDGLSVLSSLPINISDKVDVNIDDIRAKAAQLIYKKKLKILYVDYLQLIEADETNRNINREQQISKISRGCKTMSMEFGIPVVLLAQLNREVEKSPDKKPQLHHLRESGSLEQDGDGVIFLHRDWKSGITQDEHGSSTEHHADVIIAKWRDGQVGTFKIGFDGPKMRFYDPETEYDNRQVLPKPSGPGRQWEPFPE